MPTQIRPPSVPAIDQTGMADVHATSITPLAIIAVLVLVLHLAFSAALERSHAGTANVGTEAEQSLPYD